MNTRLMMLACLGALGLSTAQAASLSTDAVVIGSGGAGLSAAVTLHDLGEKVIVLEKMPIIGGNTIRAEGGINAAETEQQKKAGIPDTIAQFYEDSLKGGKGKNDPALLHTMTEHAKDSVAWLVKLGADLSVVGRAGGAKYNRAHRPTGGGAIGPEIIKTLWKATKERHIDIRYNSRVVEVLKNKAGAVDGVVVQGKDGKRYEIHARAVILATGGFGANQALVPKYRAPPVTGLV